MSRLRCSKSGKCICPHALPLDEHRTPPIRLGPHAELQTATPWHAKKEVGEAAARWPHGTLLSSQPLACAAHHDRRGTIMLGPADIEDMMLEFAAAEAAAKERGPSDSSHRPPTSWSWGSGPSTPYLYEPSPWRCPELPISNQNLDVVQSDFARQ